MTEMAGSIPQPRRWAVLAWVLNPYVQIVFGALCDSAGEVLLKKGANSAHSLSGVAAFVGITPLASIWTWIGIISYITGLVSWLHVLRFVPVSIAFPLINAVHLFVPIGAWLFLHEQIEMRRWIGIGLVICGVLTLIKPLMRAEEDL